MGRPAGVKKQQFICSIPHILYARMIASIKEKGVTQAAYIERLVRQDLDGPDDSRIAEVPKIPATPATNLKPTAAQIAAKFGIKTAATLERELVNGADALTVVDDEPEFDLDRIPAPIKTDWRRIYMEASEMEPYEAEHFMKEKISGELPTGFWKMPADRQVKWLEANR